MADRTLMSSTRFTTAAAWLHLPATQAVGAAAAAFGILGIAILTPLGLG